MSIENIGPIATVFAPEETNTRPRRNVSVTCNARLHSTNEYWHQLRDRAAFFSMMLQPNRREWPLTSDPRASNLPKLTDENAADCQASTARARTPAPWRDTAAPFRSTRHALRRPNVLGPSAAAYLNVPTEAVDATLAEKRVSAD